MKAAIFDMDGTVLDSMGMWRNALPAFMEQCGLSADEDFFKNTTTMGMYETAQYLIDNYSLSLTAEELRQKWEQNILSAYLTAVQPKPYAVEYLLRLKERGVKLAIATLTEHKMADEALAKHGLDSIFDIVLTCEDVGGVSKTEPDLFLKAAELLGATAEESVVFEDSLYAMIPAIEAGFTVVAIEEPHAARHEEIKTVATRYISGWKELYDELEPATV